MFWTALSRVRSKQSVIHKCLFTQLDISFELVVHACTQVYMNIH
jgi:hypothetical protein